MYMNVTKRITTIIAMLAIALLSLSCSNDTDTTLTSQQKAIENYLKGSHRPPLIEEIDIPESMDEQPQFYTHWALNVFRYIATYYDEVREQKPIIERGTTFDIRYTAYTFKSGAPTINDMFATNDQAKIDELYRGYDDENVWSTEPMRITLGKQDLVSGLERALEGCREGDKIEVYLTFDAAYGKDYVGMVPSKTSVMWEIEILDVIE
jgi:hypothetical protein